MLSRIIKSHQYQSKGTRTHYKDETEVGEIMSKAQVTYMVIAFVYLCLFALFMRFFYYKRYADKHHWKRKPNLSLDELRALYANANRELPLLSLMIPAKNEAAVIERTLQHMVALNYPVDKYEIHIVTDEKERRQHQDEKDKIIPQLLDKLNKNCLSCLTEKERLLILSVIAHILLAEYPISSHWYLGPMLTQPTSHTWQQAQILVELVLALIESPKAFRQQRASLKKRRGLNLGHLSWEGQVAAQSPYHAWVLPVLGTFMLLQGTSPFDVQYQLQRYLPLSDNFSKSVVSQLVIAVSINVQGIFTRKLKSHTLRDIFQEAHTHLVPTTHHLVNHYINQREERYPQIQHHSVPVNFDGSYGGTLLPHDVPSTKGRALNYVLPHLSDTSAMCGFYDAESRPDEDVLLHVAYQCLQGGPSNRILQGPIFQVRNFYDMSPFCKIAALYQSVTHDWAMPVTFRTLPFVGGTNVFISINLIKSLRGYDQHILTEDLELGVRAFLDADVWPEYLTCYTSEQTPPVFKAFYKQRLRWATGHLQVLDKFKNSSHPTAQKKRLLHCLYLKGPVEWTFYQCASLMPLLVLCLFIAGLIDPTMAPLLVRATLHCLSIVYISFTFYCYVRYSKHVDLTARPRGRVKRATALGQLFFLPFAAFFFPVPFSSALLLKKLNLHPTAWTKTPRTRE